MRYNTIRYSILRCVAMACVMAICGCTSDSVSNFWGTGRIYPSVTLDASLANPQGASGAILQVPQLDDISLKITNIEGGESHTWRPWTAYKSTDGLRASTYRVEAFYGDSTREGFDCPWFFASRVVNVPDGSEQTIDLCCKLANSLWRLDFSDTMNSRFGAYEALLHTSGNNYVAYTSGESRPIYVKAGRLATILDLTLLDGRDLRFVAAEITQNPAGQYNEMAIGLRHGESGADEIVVTDGSQSYVWPLTEAFLNAAAPEIEVSGFEDDEIIMLDEGSYTGEPLLASTALGGLRKLLLNISTVSANFANLPGEIDLVTADAEMISRLAQCGIVVTKTGSNVSVDLSRMPGMLEYTGEGDISWFSLIAVNNFSKVSPSLSLGVKVNPVGMRLESVSPAIIGLNECYLKIYSDTPLGSLLQAEAYVGTDRWTPIEILSIENLGQNLYGVNLLLPDGQQTLPVRILYNNQVKFILEVRRVSPRFTITADMFAQKAYITIHPEDEAMLGIITSMVRIFSDRTELSVIERNEDTGMVVVAGLTGNTRYDLRATVMNTPIAEADFTPTIVERTETSAQFGNGSFEDTKETIRYNGLLAGGRYSQSVVAIFNQQNKVDILLSTPKQWCTVNDKTFCMSAQNQNTWYMQPSTYIVADGYTGAYAVKLQSVAWDANGEYIPDYLQTSQPYLNYNPNIPNISHRAAGRLFLGSYSYNPLTNTETYVEGLDFTSRPSAVSGVYKYLPCDRQPDDCGLARVEILGYVGNNLTVIGSGSIRLTPSTDYMAFSLPITYTTLGVKAAVMKLLFASTDNVGDIAYETARIRTVSNPVTSTSLGSALWLDDIALTY